MDDPPNTEWDGSLCGTITHKEIRKDKLYWEFSIASMSYFVTVKIDRASLYCIFDETLEDFGFAKIGTRKLLIGTTPYTCANFDSRWVVPFVACDETSSLVRERIQLYTVLRWVFCVPVKVEKELFFVEGRLYGKYSDIGLESQGYPQREWFPLTFQNAKKKLLRGKNLEGIMRKVASRIERINRQAFPYLSIARDRLSMLRN